MIPFALLAADWWRLPFYWHLPLLVVVISLVYSATRFDHWDHIWREALRWGVRLLAFLVGVLFVLFVLATYIG